MLSKIAPIALMSTASAFKASNHHIQARPDRDLVKQLKNPRPRVNAGDCNEGGYSVERLKKGPANIPVVLASGEKWSDTEWTGKDVLYKAGYPNSATETLWGNNYDNGIWTYERWTDISNYSTATLFKDDTATYTEARQGGAGTCYFISAIASAAEWPSMITDMFLTGTDMTGPDAGIIGVRFYIRGKPWVVTIDEKLFWYTSSSNKYLKFNQPDTTNKIFWAAILEKAWAKVKGNYEMAEGGFVITGLRTLTGAPVFKYDTKDIGTSSGLSMDATFDLLAAADDADYPIGAGTAGGGDDSGRNDCGIATSHAYSVLATFEMDSTDMLLMRNPWGVTYYTGIWKYDDSNWTDALVAQVPFGIDPRTSYETLGIFTMPMSIFGMIKDSSDADYACISDFEIAHMRDSEGYTGDWYDAESMDESTYSYYITVPENEGALYFTVESYYQNLIPNECTSGTVTFSNGNSANLANPLLDYEVWKDGASSYLAYKYVSDQFSYPILVTSYNAGDIFKVVVKYMWFDSPAKDYTVKIYSKQTLEVKNSSGETNVIHMDGQEPSGFTTSTYRGMNPPATTVTPITEVIVIEKFSDIFATALAGDNFVFAVIAICFTYPMVCFNPANWFG
jgi:hypothetical protein